MQITGSCPTPIKSSVDEPWVPKIWSKTQLEDLLWDFIPQHRLGTCVERVDGPPTQHTHTVGEGIRTTPRRKKPWAQQPLIVIIVMARRWHQRFRLP